MKDRLIGLSRIAAAGAFAVAGCAPNGDGSEASPSTKPEYLDRAYISDFSLTQRNGITGRTSLTRIMSCYSDERPAVDISNNKSIVVYDSSVVCTKSESVSEGYFNSIGVDSGREYPDLILATQHEVTITNQE